MLQLLTYMPTSRHEFSNPFTRVRLSAWRRRTLEARLAYVVNEKIHVRLDTHGRVVVSNLIFSHFKIGWVMATVKPANDLDALDPELSERMASAPTDYRGRPNPNGKIQERPRVSHGIFTDELLAAYRREIDRMVVQNLSFAIALRGDMPRAGLTVQIRQYNRALEVEDASHPQPIRSESDERTTRRVNRAFRSSRDRRAVWTE